MAVITVADIKAHLNITDDADDALLEQYVEAAEGWIEIFTGANLAELTPTPGPIKQAIRMLAGSFYENREDVLIGINAESVPHGVHELIAPFRNWSF